MTHGISQEQLSFSGKTVLITGAAGGIGSAMARAFAAHGAALKLADKNSVALDSLATELAGEGVQVATLLYDQSKEPNRRFEGEKQEEGVRIVPRRKEELLSISQESAAGRDTEIVVTIAMIQGRRSKKEVQCPLWQTSFEHFRQDRKWNPL